MPSFAVLHRYSGAQLYAADLTDLREVVMQAVAAGANLRNADLWGANLWGAAGIVPERVCELLMLRDQPGPIRAYKLVTAEGVGPFNGGVTYRVGERVEISEADTDVTVNCAPGVNVATLAWCLKEWKPGYRVLLVEFVAADIAAIPTASDGKFRLHRCVVVGEKDLTGLVPVESAAAPEGDRD